MKRHTIVEIHTNGSGHECLVTCPHLAGAWCDAFVKPVAPITMKTARYERCKECLDNEISLEDLSSD